MVYTERGHKGTLSTLVKMLLYARAEYSEDFMENCLLPTVH